MRNECCALNVYDSLSEVNQQLLASLILDANSVTAMCFNKTDFDIVSKESFPTVLARLDQTIAKLFVLAKSCSSFDVVVGVERALGTICSLASWAVRIEAIDQDRFGSVIYIAERLHHVYSELGKKMADDVSSTL